MVCKGISVEEAVASQLVFRPFCNLAHGQVSERDQQLVVLSKASVLTDWRAAISVSV